MDETIPSGRKKYSSLADPFKELGYFERTDSSTPGMIALVDRAHLFRMVNDAFCQAFGRNRETLLGTPVADLLQTEASGNPFRDHMDRTFAGETVVFEQWFSLPPLGRRFLSMTYHPVRESGGTIDNIFLDVRDITDFKRAESERQRVFDASPDMLGIAGFDGYLKDLNPSWTRILGWQMEELRSRPYQALIHPQDLEATLEAEERLLLRQKISGFENRILCKDDSYRWISWSAFADIKRKEFFLVGRDVTESKMLAEVLRYSEKKYRTIFDSAGDYLFVHDFSWIILDVNQVACEKLGFAREDLLKQSLLDICGETRTRMGKILSQLQKTGEACIETRLVGADGKERNIWINSRAIEYDAEQAVLSVARDISERKQMEEKLRTLATLDPLTETSNRRHFLECARKELMRSRRYASPLPMLILDIDHFKNINDCHGHHVGDKVLKSVASTCLSTLRATDIFGRLGGEEFVALLPHTDPSGARLTAERLRQALAQLRVGSENGPINITVSIGLAMAESEDGSVEEVLQRADTALYEAKAKGRNRVEVG
ncbi:MAG: diguanylate cyclase [Syntrophotaleaceae bacterium]